MNQSMRALGFFTLLGLLALPSSTLAYQGLRLQGLRLAQHQAFVDANKKKTSGYKNPKKTCEAAYESGYKQALGMESTTEIVSSDAENPTLHPLVAKILGPDQSDPNYLKHTYNAVKEEFTKENPLNTAMLCHETILASFDAATGAPTRTHAELRDDVKCCIDGYKKGQDEAIQALDQNPSPSVLCTDLYNAGIDSVKDECKNLNCHEEIDDEKARFRAILVTVHAAIPNDFTDYLKSKFGFCFEESTDRERRLRYRQMLKHARSCFSWGRGAGKERCAKLLLQQREAQSTSASPVSDVADAMKPAQTTTVAPATQPSTSGAAAK